MLMKGAVLATVLVALAGVGTSAHAGYPERPITIIVPFAPGGGDDATARLIASQLPDLIGQPVVVENRPGAGANIGIAAAARSEPDGYTVLYSSSAIIVNPSMPRGAPFDPFKDFAPVVDVGAAPNVFVVRPDSPFKSINDLIDAAKADPDAVDYSVPGLGGVSHLATELFMKKTDMKMTYVPFNGSGPGLQGLLNGTVDVFVANMASLLGQVRSGQLRALAQTGAQRYPDLADIPTLKELGIDVEAETSYHIYVPAGTPDDIRQMLTKSIQQVLTKPEIKAQIAKIGLPVTAGGPEAVTARLEREVPLWAEVIKGINLEAQ